MANGFTTAFTKDVSTHSRPKAAGNPSPCLWSPSACFNTQPPEGGWGLIGSNTDTTGAGFNTQPPEGGWLELESEPVVKLLVSTHSRPKAAGFK